MAHRAAVSLVFLGIMSAVSLQQGDTCSPLELVIARGTTEPRFPNYGIIVGDPLYQATKRVIPEVTGYSVDYPASFESESRFMGAKDTVEHITEQSEKCPDQKYALVGYSQGAEVMHIAGNDLDPGLYPKIVAVAMFGDPGNKYRPISPFGNNISAFPADLANKLKQNCAKDDIACTNGGESVEAHLTYSAAGTTFMQDTADYFKQQLETDGQAGPVAALYGGLVDKELDNTAAFLRLNETVNPNNNPNAAAQGML